MKRWLSLAAAVAFPVGVFAAQVGVFAAQVGVFAAQVGVFAAQVGVLAALSMNVAVAAEDKPTFVFTAIPDQDQTRLVERFTRVAEYLQGKLGVPVRYVPVKSYPAAVTAFTNNEVQLAWFGGVTGVQARATVPGSQAIAQGEEDKRFKFYLIANTETGLKRGPTIDGGLAGKTFTFGARASTSGRVMPDYYLRQRFGKGTGRHLQPRRLLRRPQPHHPARPVRRLPGRRRRLHRVGPGEEGRPRRRGQGLRDLGEPAVPRLPVDDPGRPRRPLRAGLHRQGEGRTRRHHRPKDPRTVRPQPLRPRRQRRVQAGRRGRQSRAVS